MRKLTWNNNYNVKPREIAGALHRLHGALAHLLQPGSSPEADENHPPPVPWGVVRLAMAAVGRGGSGEQGQRVRDEILDI